MLLIVFILFAVLAVVLQTSICLLSPVWLLAPDLYYILVAYLAYRFDLLRSLIILFFLGCMLDVFSGTVLGMYSLMCLSAFFLLRFISRKMPVNESLYQVPLIGVSFVAISWVAYVLLSLFEPGVLVEWSWWKMMVRTGLIVLFAYPLFRLFNATEQRLRKGVLTWRKVRVRTDNRYRSRSTR